MEMGGSCLCESWESVQDVSVLLLGFVLHGLEHLVGGLVDLESEDARHVGVFRRRRDALRENVREEVCEGGAKVCAIDVCA